MSNSKYYRDDFQMSASKKLQNQAISPQTTTKLDMKLQNQTSQADQEIHNLIYEYLSKKSYKETLTIFQRERLRQKSFKITNENVTKAQLLESFDDGDRDQFFYFWKKMPSHINKKQKELKLKVEFYMNIYFAIYDLHPSIKKKGKTLVRQSIDRKNAGYLKSFLDEKGQELSEITQECLPLYALPYIPNPQTHKGYSYLFQNKWIADIRHQLVTLCNKTFISEKEPALVKLYFDGKSGKKGQSNQERHDLSQVNFNKNHQKTQKQLQNALKQINDLQYEKQDLLNVIEDFTEKYGQIQKNNEILQQREEFARKQIEESHNKWQALMKELLVISQDFSEMIFNQKRDGINNRKYQSLIKRMLKYEKFLGIDIQEQMLKSQNDVSLFNDVTSDIITMSVTPKQNFQVYPEVSQIQNQQQDQEYYQDQVIEENEQEEPIYQYQLEQEQEVYMKLNFEKIKDVLASFESEPVVCALLQALRWRITRTQDFEYRRQIFSAYIENDLFSFNQDIGILDTLLASSQKVRRFLTKLLNVIASQSIGIKYLVASDQVIPKMIRVLQQESEDNIVRRNGLAILQKLSLTKKPQLLMIKKGLIKWIIVTLKCEKDTLSQFSLEYMTALLMNLSLRTLGKEKCEEKSIGVIPTLISLIDHENEQVKTFIFGLFYSLMERPKLKQQAIKLNLKEILIQQSELNGERQKQQTEYILQALERDETMEEDLDEGSLSDEDNDVDEFEDDEEIGEDEQVDDTIPEQGDLVGEKLLLKDFCLNEEETIIHSQVIQNKQQGNRKISQSDFYSKNEEYPDDFDQSKKIMVPMSQNYMTNDLEYPDDFDNTGLNTKQQVTNNDKQYINVFQAQQQLSRTPNDQQAFFKQKRKPKKNKQKYQNEISYDSSLDDKNFIIKSQVSVVSQQYNTYQRNKEDKQQPFRSRPKIPRTPNLFGM